MAMARGRAWAEWPPATVIRHKSYRAMRWRNGRGWTLEIAREPESGAEFAWRLSLATVAEDCDFSIYPGYRRALVLVAGNNLRLRFRGHGSGSLGPSRRGTRFEGDWKTHCRVSEGGCTDLSLIVRSDSAARSACILRVPQVLPVKSTRRIALSRDLYGALFVLDGSVAATESSAARPRTLHTQDTLILSPRSGRILTLRRLGRHPARVVFLRWRAAAVK